MSSRTKDNSNEPMNEYLWGRSGAPDSEIERLETLLAEFRAEEHPLVLPAESAEGGAGSFFTRALRGLQAFASVPRLAAAAAVLIAVGVSLYIFLRPVGRPPDTGAAWNISNLEGTPQIGSKSMSGDRVAKLKLQVGQTLTTDSSSRVSLSENDLGEIQVEPNSRLRLLQSGPEHKRIELEVGTIHAAIWAPPGQFVVNTPSAVAVDLGCAYTLQVASDGSGTIRTTLGWVGFHLNGRDSFIPAGAMCSTRPNVGPGTPYFEDASEAFRDALHGFDNASYSDAARSRQLEIVLREARAKDALTLWHLLSRTSGQERSRVYDRLAALVTPPHDATREGILALDPHMLDLYWNALNLGDISIWRFWERSEVKK